MPYLLLVFVTWSTCRCPSTSQAWPGGGVMPWEAATWRATDCMRVLPVAIDGCDGLWLAPAHWHSSAVLGSERGTARWKGACDVGVGAWPSLSCVGFHHSA